MGGTLPRRPPLRRRRPVLVLACCAVLGGLCVPLPADDWPGWRGLERQGVSEGAVGPVHWSAKENVVWKTKIPGEGHSSPIVFGDSIFVTTACDLGRYGELAIGLRWALLLLTRIVALRAIGLLVGECAAPGNVGLRWLLGPARLGVAAGVLLATVLFAEEYLDFGRGTERAWLVATLFGCVGLRLWAVGFRDPVLGQRAVGASLLLLGVAVAASVPDRASMFAEGPFGARAVFCYLVIALPVLSAARLQTLSRAGEGRRRGPTQDPTALPGSALDRLLRRAPVVGAAVVFFIALVLAVTQSRQSTTNLTVKPVGVSLTSWVLLAALPHQVEYIPADPAGQEVGAVAKAHEGRHQPRSAHPAEARVTLGEKDAGALPRSRQRRGDAGRAATGDEDIDFVADGDCAGEWEGVHGVSWSSFQAASRPRASATASCSFFSSTSRGGRSVRYSAT